VVRRLPLLWWAYDSSMSSALGPRRGGERVGAPLDRLVARRHELDAAQRALSESRLLTLTGPGGVGKTRLARELAYRVSSKFSDGAWLVRLADLSIGAGPDEVDSALVNALGISDQSATGPREKLLSFLADRKLLVILDNCEHVLPSVRDVVSVLLGEAPHLRVIATSREPLAVAGEALRPVFPLSVPEAGTPAEQLIADGSVSLLIERARAVDPDFQVTDDNAEAVVELCRLLEGIPLAIELAAVKLRALSVEQVVQRFGQRLTSLSVPPTSGPAVRHQSLRSMVDWSYELCPHDAQVLWRRLSVIPGTFDLELAESVCAFGELDPEDVIDSIERLVGQSILLTGHAAGVMRYRLLAPLREVAGEVAERAGESAELQRRHRDAMLERAQQVASQWCGPEQDLLIARMGLDHANYVAALQWSAATAGEEQVGLLLLAALRYHWLSGGLLAEGRMRTETTLAAVTEPSAARAECLWVASWIALVQGDRHQAERWLDELAVLAKQLEDPRLDLHVQHWTGLLAMFSGDVDEAVRRLGVAVDGHRARGDREMELTARYALTTALAVGGHAEDALAMSYETVALCEENGEQNARAYVEWAAGVAHWTLGHLDEAERSARTVLKTHRMMADLIGVALTTELLSWIAYDRKQTAHAEALSAAASHVWRTLGTSLTAFGPQLSRFAEGHARGSDEGRVAHRLRDLDDVIDFVLGVGGDRGRPGRTDVGTPLTKRELQVAELIESGLSNREIAERLVISKRTAEGHVERILAKLGFSSRAQVAVWMARRAS
jgi:predicted ATPase/DNA-binding CsgD family transcriptional regulator